MSEVLSEPLAVIGSFLLGVAGGAVAVFFRRKTVIGAPEREQASVCNWIERIPELQPHVVVKALIVSRDPGLIKVLSTVLREKHIETVFCDFGSDAIGQLSAHRFEAIVLDFDKVADCAKTLRSVRGTNRGVLAIAVASESSMRQSASNSGANFIIARPVCPGQIRELLRSTYGHMLRDRQEYFRLAADVPVWVRRASGSLLQCATLNLSQRGMAVSTTCALRTSEDVNLGFAIPNADLFVSADGKVVWYDEVGTAGITFECSNPTAQKRYFAWLHDHFCMSMDTPVQHPEPTEQVEHAG